MPVKLYSLPLSPFASRVRLAIYHKHLDVEIVPPPEGGTKSDAYLAKNPMGHVPALELDSGFTIAESAVIIEYLEDAYPTPSLRPEAPKDRARARMLARIPDFHIAPSVPALFAQRDPATRDEAAVTALLGTLNRGLGYLEHFLGGGRYAVGDSPSLADCSIVPMLAVLNVMPIVIGRPTAIGDHPKLAAYVAAMGDDPANAKLLGEMNAAFAERSRAQAGRAQQA